MDPLLKGLIEGAAAHGKESAPDHEIGDLIAILQSCWALLIPEARKAVGREFSEVAAWAAEGSDECTECGARFNARPGDKRPVCRGCR